MANTINYITEYLPKVIDKVNKEVALSSDLNVNSGDVKMGIEGSNEVKLKQIITSGLGDYSRSTGLASGDITISWDTHELAIERGKKFNLDILDSMESQTQLMEVVGEFQRVQVVPERDAYVFSKAYSNADASTTATPADLTSATVKAAVDAGIKELNENEGSKIGRRMYVSTEVFDFLKNSNFFTYNLDASMTSARDTRFGMYDGMNVIEVPSSRFNTAITLGADGYTTTGVGINFLIVCDKAVQVIEKLVKQEVVGSQYNTDTFGDIYKYLLAYDAITPSNQATAIYAHARAT